MNTLTEVDPDYGSDEVSCYMRVKYMVWYIDVASQRQHLDEYFISAWEMN
jgi:hypothetical protein